MRKGKAKLTKKKKKFFIIASCYVAVFLVTSITTLATMAWFNSSTWQTEVLYMGGPVYIDFTDDEGLTKKSGEGQLVTETPPNWDMLYPGMNIHFEAKAIIIGSEFTHYEEKTNKTTIVTTTGAILRARVMLEVTDPQGNKDTAITNDLYNAIWPQLKQKALLDNTNDGVWIFDEQDTDVPEHNYFYYSEKNQVFGDTSNYYLQEVGGISTNVTVGFLNNVVITMPGVELTNAHADCRIKFTIVFHALQAFLPYEPKDVGTAYQGSALGHGALVTDLDVGDAKPLTLGNSRGVFAEAFDDIYTQGEHY